MWAGRSAGGRKARSSVRLAAPCEVSSSWRALISAVRRDSSRPSRSRSARGTTAPQCGSADSGDSAPPAASMPYRCTSALECRRARAPPMVRRTWERPERGVPRTYRCPKRVRSSSRGSWRWAPGRSARPQTTGARRPSAGSGRSGSSARLTACGSAGSQGLGCRSISRSAAACWTASTRAVRSVGASRSSIASWMASKRSAVSSTGSAAVRPSSDQVSSLVHTSASDCGCALCPASSVSWDVACAPSRTAPTKAVWNGSTERCPIRARARPGVSLEMDTASLTSRTSWLSRASVTRSEIRRLVLARMSAVTTPAGRWVASSRCRPSERPRWAMPTSPGTNSGTSRARVANSSMMSSSLGSGAIAGSRRRIARYSVWSLAPASARRRSRRVSSAVSEVRARSTRWLSRSVTMPSTCGSRSQPAKALPPL